MTSNHFSFLGRHFTQISEATIGGPDAGAIMDIFGAIYIDKIIYEDCPYQIDEYRRHRDDTINISSETTIAYQEVINDWLNNNIYKDKFKWNVIRYYSISRC